MFDLLQAPPGARLALPMSRSSGSSAGNHRGPCSMPRAATRWAQHWGVLPWLCPLNKRRSLLGRESS